MKHLRFWRTVRYFLLILIVGNGIWQLGSLLTNINNGTVGPLALSVGIVGFLVLLLVLVLVSRRLNAKAITATDKIIKLALDQGYQEHHLTPLSYAVSPFGKKYKTGMAGAPILAWDEERLELFVQLPGVPDPQSLRSGHRANAKISLERIVMGNPFWGKAEHPLWGEQPGFRIDFRRAEPAEPATLVSWKFVPFTRNYRTMRRAAVAELVARMNHKLSV